MQLLHVDGIVCWNCVMRIWMTINFPGVVESILQSFSQVGEVSWNQSWTDIAYYLYKACDRISCLSGVGVRCGNKHCFIHWANLNMSCWCFKCYHYYVIVVLMKVSSEELFNSFKPSSLNLLELTTHQHTLHSHFCKTSKLYWEQARLSKKNIDYNFPNGEKKQVHWDVSHSVWNQIFFCYLFLLIWIFGLLNHQINYDITIVFKNRLNIA